MGAFGKSAKDRIALVLRATVNLDLPFGEELCLAARGSNGAVSSVDSCDRLLRGKLSSDLNKAVSQDIVAAANGLVRICDQHFCCLGTSFVAVIFDVFVIRLVTVTVVLSGLGIIHHGVTSLSCVTSHNPSRAAVANSRRIRLPS